MFALDRYSGSGSSCHCCQVKYICVLWQDTYNTAYEVDRKRALGIILSQSRQQDHEDAKVLEEAKRITEARLDTKVC
jgi:hypothetical protein